MTLKNNNKNEEQQQNQEQQKNAKQQQQNEEQKWNEEQQQLNITKTSLEVLPSKVISLGVFVLQLKKWLQKCY